MGLKYIPEFFDWIRYNVVPIGRPAASNRLPAFDFPDQSNRILLSAANKRELEHSGIASRPPYLRSFRADGECSGNTASYASGYLPIYSRPASQISS